MRCSVEFIDCRNLNLVESLKKHISTIEIIIFCYSFIRGIEYMVPQIYKLKYDKSTRNNN